MHLRAYYSNQLIKNKIFLITAVIMTLVSGLSMVAVHYATQIYEDKVYAEAAQVLNLSSGMVDGKLREIEDLTFDILSDRTIQTQLSSVTGLMRDYDYFKMKDKLTDRLIELAQHHHAVSAIQINDVTGGESQAAITSRYRLDTAEYERRAMEAGGSVVWLPAEEPNVLIAVRQIRRMSSLSLKNLGVMIVYIDMKRLTGQSLELSGDRYFVMEHAGRVVLSNGAGSVEPLTQLPLRERQGYTIAKMNGETFFITHLISKYQSFTYYNVLPYGSVFLQSNMIKYGLFGVYALLFGLALYIARVAGRSISRPLEQLTAKMKLVQKGNFNTEELFQGDNPNMDETGQIHRHFRLMLETINALIRENYAKQLAINESEYKALQAQINPHFLYNTLESINWMAKTNRQPDISAMVTALGRLLRGIISRKEPLITIEEEMRIVRNYLTIQQIRFGERLQFRIEGEEQLSGCYIPKLTVQPVLENAIQHGLEAMSSPCTITLSFESGDSHITIRVTDDGPGIDEATLLAIKEGYVVPKGTGIGLSNIRERIRLMFGDEYGVDIDSDTGKGTTVRIRVPYRWEDEDV
ncbi:two-component system sensor histidine kinase YesM [Paenibacillus phyllosphaerae]|uniref:histidine kinase n=1 Tax=Paenibacillus phyllosphaerae TaxID=274593 RepID=A0A7W5AZM4_9BACL|nr:sensor histidine kinase [Paenibacillus phyllosphaerae]MBB3111695.1 two-component system sensor histidine kinase YesM [Paenibacillus phyllosphaerae]